ncbi:hypothetical protein AYI68_g4301, partial [Smittium mucronatum]
YKTLHRGWYWDLQPAKFVLAKYRANQADLFCRKPDCSGPNRFNKDSNGYNANTHAEFRCSGCGAKYRPELFWTEIMGGRISDLPEPTSWKSLLPPEERTAAYADLNSDSDISFEESPPINPLSVSLPDPKHSADRSRFLPEIVNSVSKKRTRSDDSDEDDPPVGQSTFFRVLKKYKEDAQLSTDLVNQQLKAENKELKDYIFKLTNQMSMLQNKLDDLSKNVIPTEACESPSSESTCAATLPSSTEFSSPASNSENSSLSPATPSSRSSGPTIHAMAMAQNLTGSVEEYNRLSNALKSLAGQKYSAGTLKAELKHGVSRIYVGRIGRQKISLVKKKLADLRFKMSKILNIRFIGNDVVEFTVFANYCDGFLARMDQFKKFPILPKINPSLPLNKSASADIRNKVKESYKNSLVKTLNESDSQLLKDFVVDLASELDIDLEYSQSDNNASPSLSTASSLILKTPSTDTAFSYFSD